MSEKETNQSRINLLIPLELAIKIDMDIDKRGITKTQYAREALYEKINRAEFPNLMLQEVSQLKGEVNDLKINIQELKSILLSSLK